MTITEREKARRWRCAVFAVACSAIPIVVGTHAPAAEAAAEYVPRASVEFSDPSPRQGDVVVVTCVAEAGTMVLVAIDGETLGEVVADANGNCTVEVTIPEVDGATTLVVTADGVEFGTLPIEWPEETQADGVVDGDGASALAVIDDQAPNAPEVLPFDDDVQPVQQDGGGFAFPMALGVGAVSLIAGAVVVLRG